jgi:putative ABC transport system permease protein
MSSFASIFRSAYRSLRGTPLVSGLAILSLALGIGANTALFSILNGLMLRPLPVRDPGSLVHLDNGSWTYPIWAEIRARETDLFDGALAWGGERFDLAQGGETQPVEGAYVSGRYFDVLGISAARGRLLTEVDDRPGGGPDGAVAVISHRFWQTHFGAAEAAVGRQITLQRVPFTVVGVMPQGFTGTDIGRVADVMIPFATEPRIRGAESTLNARSTWWLEIMARTKPGQTAEQATAALRAVQPQIREATLPPQYNAEMRQRYLNEGFTLVPAPNGSSPVGNRYQAPLYAMLGVVALVLLIACANIANLLVARALAREQELSVRLALGASRWQVAALLLGESLLIAGSGAALGFVFAQWSGPLLVQQFVTWREAVILDVSPDWRVVAFTTIVTVVTAMIAGVAPAWSAAALAPYESLRTAGRGIIGDRRFSLRGALVVVQLALSIMLVVAAALFLRSLNSLNRAPLGFSPEPLVVADLALQMSPTTPQERPALLQRMADAVAAVPGVTAAAASMITPTSGRGWNTLIGEGPMDRSRMSWMNAVGPGWFRTYGIQLLAGRDFDTNDRAGSEPVAIVNQTFAARFLKGAPVGQVIPQGGPGGTKINYRVVGLVSDAVYRAPREGMTPTMYVALVQRDQMFPNASVTMAAAPGQRGAVVRGISEALQGVDPRASFTFRTFDELLEATIVQDRLVAALSGFFGGLALLLAAIGLYGVMAHSVGRRRTEIGIRMALGAEPSNIQGLVLRRVGWLVGLGITLGMVLSVWASQFVQTMLFELDAQDPVTLGGAAILLVLVAVTAAWIPARRAAAMDPARVLRNG